MRGFRPTTGAGAAGPIRSRLDRLVGLPIRPATVRSLLRSSPELPPGLDLIDPGWAVLVSSRGIDLALELLPDAPFWPPCRGPAADARDRLWRFSVAAAISARRLTGPARDPDSDAAGRSGLLHPMALWALAAVDPEALAEWLSADEDDRRRLESSWFGRDPAGFGHSIARRWGCEQDVLDATLLGGRSSLIPSGLANAPDRLDRIRAGRQWAMRTPWALPGLLLDVEPGNLDRRRLIAEVQSLTPTGLAPAEPSPLSDDLLRDGARLFARNRRLEGELADLDRRLDSSVSPSDRPGERDASPDASAVLDAMAEFAAGAAHELNNPLAIVAGRAQLLQARLDDPDHRHALQTIIGQTRRAHQILRDLIYIARTPTPRQVPCVPDQVLRDVVTDLDSEARSRQISLICTTSSAPATVSTDPEALRHLADVLVRNALEATGPGGEVVVESIDDPQWILWQVRDDGIGLDEDRAAHLLDPFYCGRQAGRGLGLGLPRVARFVREVGGRIQWGRSEGHGTIVRVELPITGQDGSLMTDPPRPGFRDVG